MITVALVAILVALAIPSYTNYVRKANRGDAQALLLKWANNQEVWRASNTSYAGTGDIPAPTHPRYTFSFRAGPTNNTYEIQAVAGTTGGQNQDAERGTSCTPLTLDHLGQKGPAKCWQE